LSAATAFLEKAQRCSFHGLGIPWLRITPSTSLGDLLAVGEPGTPSRYSGQVLRTGTVLYCTYCTGTDQCCWPGTAMSSTSDDFGPVGRTGTSLAQTPVLSIPGQKRRPPPPTRRYEVDVSRLLTSVSVTPSSLAL
jgi:hypothetical protein